MKKEKIMTMQQPPQTTQKNAPGKTTAPAQKSAQGAKPVYPDTTKIDQGGKKKSDDSCGC